MQKKNLFFLKNVVYCVIALFFLGNVAYGGEMKVLAPSSVKIGVPFLIRFKTEATDVQGTLYWCDQKIPLYLAEKNDFTQTLLLGTSVKTAVPGRATLRIETLMGNGIKNFALPIEVLFKAYPEEHLSLPQKMVTPPSEVIPRIKRERQEVRKVLLDINNENYLELPLQKPVIGDITSTYGKQRVLNGRPSNPHTGVDLRASIGTEVRAVANGTVTLVADHYFSGKTIYINSGYGVVAMYCHLSEFLVQTGDSVSKGDIIAKTGVTGRITGPHLHFSLALQGQLVDPISLFSLDEQTFLEKNKEVLFNW
jgi:murein DD-endopeptidase MepM/ murein hydrolase activator NlpD